MLQSGLPDKVQDSEDIARFLLQKSQYNTTMVKGAAFLPCYRSEDEKRMETSVSRHGAKPIEELLNLGKSVSIASNRQLYGAGILSAEEIRSTLLEVISDELPLRHAVIIHWPLDDDPEEQKAKLKKIANELACKAGKLLFSFLHDIHQTAE